MNLFEAANILIPKMETMEKWAVIACDQFTSQPEYWERVAAYVGEDKSALKLIFPEAKLGEESSDMVEEIKVTMESYLADGTFAEYEDSLIFVERTLLDGSIRKGVVGAINLDEYDYSSYSLSGIRATEKTVVERIPPRKVIRENALVELPHILLFSDDEKDFMCGYLESVKEELPLLYDFDLMEGGGHITGRLVKGEHLACFTEKMEAYGDFIVHKYRDSKKIPMMFAVADGNHSLATAKACYEDIKLKNPGVDLSNHPARYALVEVVNIHDEAQKFEPIHRIVKNVDVNAILGALILDSCAEEGYPMRWYSGEKHGVVYLDPAKGQLPIGILQNFLDEYLSVHLGVIDYIHGEDVLKELSKEPNSIGFELPVIDKQKFFHGIIEDGVFPRKTFSTGHAQEKRYYLEARKIVME
ncbi:MAG: DUF1015 domain-containing protein [Lachnospiraceae bacterium]|nr:DUF1015 domain-containing protein [Lachnospiraceae bacterium]